jgi:hypothetical protein
LLVKVDLKATVVSLFQLTVEDEMKRCHTVSASRAHATFDKQISRICSDTAMVSTFFEKDVVSETLSRVKQRKQENLLRLSAC